MTLTQLGVVVGIMSSLALMYFGIRQARKDGKKAAVEEAKSKQETYNNGLIDGKALRDDEVRQLTSERDENARRAEENGRRADRFEGRYNDLLERRNES